MSTNNQKSIMYRPAVESADEIFTRTKASTLHLADTLETTGAELIAKAKIIRAQWDTFEHEYNEATKK